LNIKLNTNDQRINTIKRKEKILKELKTLIEKAREKDEKAMEALFRKFTPLLKSSAKRYACFGLEYDDVFQQAALIFIIAVYEFEKNMHIPFSGYIKKRINWGLWTYSRKYLRKKVEVPCGLNIKGESN